MAGSDKIEPFLMAARQGADYAGAGTRGSRTDPDADVVVSAGRPVAAGEPLGLEERLCAVPPAPLTVAPGQAPCIALDIAGNASRAAQLVRRAAAGGADLLILPELFLTGYELQTIVAEPARYTVGLEDGRLESLSAACAETRTAVVVGAPTHDVDSGRLYISALVLDRRGEFAARY